MPPYTAAIVKRVHYYAVIVCSLVRQLVGGVWLPPRATAPLHTTILSITKRQLITALGLAAGGGYGSTKLIRKLSISFPQFNCVLLLGLSQIENDYDSIWYMRHESYQYQYYRYHILI